MIHHAITAADRAAMTTLHARLAATPMTITRASFDQLVEQVPPAEGVTYTESEVGGVPGVWCTPGSRMEGTAMLYLHGGAYIMGTARGFRHFAGQLAARSGVPAFVADYRRAPESPFPAAFDDAKAAYRGLTSQFGTGRVALVGDSAGGGLALSLLQEDRRAPCGVLLSPWTDLALTGTSIEAKAADDPLLTRAALETGIRQYLRGQDARDPRASPLHGKARVTSPVQVHVGTAEILLDDALRLGSQRIEVHEWEGMPHVFPRSMWLSEAARTSHEVIASFLRANVLAPAA